MDEAGRGVSVLLDDSKSVFKLASVKLFRCSHCHNVFAKASALEDHKQIHREVKVSQVSGTVSQKSSGLETRKRNRNEAQEMLITGSDRLRPSKLEANKKIHSKVKVDQLCISGTGGQEPSELETADASSSIEELNKWRPQKKTRNTAKVKQLTNFGTSRPAQRKMKTQKKVCSKVKNVKLSEIGNVSQNHQLKKVAKMKNLKFPCSKCLLRFASLSDLITHKETHFKENSHKRIVKRQKIAKQRRIARRQKIVSGGEDGNCTVIEKNSSSCEDDKNTVGRKKSFSSEDGQSDAKQQRKFSCETCGKSFTKYSHLTDHERVHSGEKPYVCTDCGKCFSQTSVLNRHRTSLHKRKPYHCKNCNIPFEKKPALTKHIKEKHFGKPHICKYCGKAFGKHSHLIAHMRSHTGEKPFSCEECGKSFSQPSILYHHMLLHITIY